MATLSELRTRVSAKLGLDNTASGDQPLIDGWLNEGVREVLLDTHCYVAKATMNLSANVGDYDLPTTILAIHDIYVTSGGEDGMFERVSADEILRRRRADAAVAATGTTRYYAVNGANMLMVYPTPAAADTITIYYVPRPTELSSSAHDPSSTTYGGVPVEYHKAIEFYALAEGADYDDDSSSAQGERYRALYERQILKTKRRIRNRGGRSLGRATLGRRSRRYLSGDPSADVR